MKHHHYAICLTTILFRSVAIVSIVKLGSKLNEIDDELIKMIHSISSFVSQCLLNMSG